MRAHFLAHSLVLGLVCLAGACAPREQAGDGPAAPGAPASAGEVGRIQLPADYAPGGVYGLDAQTCERHGGASTTDGNGMAFCSLGAPYAVYVCEGGVIASLIERDETAKILHLSDGYYGEVEPIETASGEKWGGEHFALWMKGDEALLQGVEGDRSCLRAERF